MQTRTKQAVTIGGVLVALGSLGLMPKVITLLALNPEDYARKDVETEIVKRIDTKMDDLTARFGTLDRNFQYIAQRQDELIRLLRSEHADAAFGWEPKLP